MAASSRSRKLSLALLLLFCLGLLAVVLLSNRSQTVEFTNTLVEIAPGHITSRPPGGELQSFILPRAYPAGTLKPGERAKITYRKDWRNRAVITRLELLPKGETEAEGDFNFGRLQALTAETLSLKATEGICHYKRYPDSVIASGLQPNDFILVKYHPTNSRLWRAEKSPPLPAGVRYREVSGNLSFYDHATLKLMTGGGLDVFKLDAGSRVPRKLELNDGLVVKFTTAGNDQQIKVLAVEHCPEVGEGRVLILNPQEIKILHKIEKLSFKRTPATVVPKGVKVGHYVRVHYLRDFDEMATALRLEPALPEARKP